MSAEQAREARAQRARLRASEGRPATAVAAPDPREARAQRARLRASEGRSATAVAAQAPSGALVGIGVEMVSTPRFARALARHEARLLARVFLPGEIAYARRKRDPAHSLAARFAAKVAGRRAVAAALGAPPRLRDVEVVRRRSGEPTLALRGSADAGALRLALTLTHDDDFAVAAVFAERA